MLGAGIAIIGALVVVGLALGVIAGSAFNVLAGSQPKLVSVRVDHGKLLAVPIEWAD
jgi:hypothetical protein